MFGSAGRTLTEIASTRKEGWEPEGVEKWGPTRAAFEHERRRTRRTRTTRNGGRVKPRRASLANILDAKKQRRQKDRGSRFSAAAGMLASIGHTHECIGVDSATSSRGGGSAVKRRQEEWKSWVRTAKALGDAPPLPRSARSAPVLAAAAGAPTRPGAGSGASGGVSAALRAAEERSLAGLRKLSHASASTVAIEAELAELLGEGDAASPARPLPPASPDPVAEESPDDFFSAWASHHRG